MKRFSVYWWGAEEGHLFHCFLLHLILCVSSIMLNLGKPVQNESKTKLNLKLINYYWQNKVWISSAILEQFFNNKLVLKMF